MVTENCPVAPGRAMSIEDVEKSAGVSVSPAAPGLHGGNKYIKGPSPIDWNKLARDADLHARNDPAPDSARGWEVVNAAIDTFAARTSAFAGGFAAGAEKPTTLKDFPQAGGCVPPRATGMLPEMAAPYGVSPPGRNIPADCVLPNDPFQRKKIPAAAVLDYFDAAIVEIAKALQAGNDEHNPGEPLHWARGKSPDQDHCIIRHFLERGTIYVDRNGVPVRHSTSLAIRALMLLQLELEAAGAPMSRGSRPAKI